MTSITETDIWIYGAFGYTVARTVCVVRTGYAGEVREIDLPWYYLGERLYIPWLRCFISPDKASPFDEGGFNRFAYCAGDPLNRVDPSGRGWLDWLWQGLAIVGAVVGTIVTGGALAGVLAGTIVATVASTISLAAATVLSVASVGVEIASAVTMAEGDYETSSMLGFAGLGLGVASAALSGLGTVTSRVGQFVGGGVLAAKGATVGRATTSTAQAIVKATGASRAISAVGTTSKAMSSVSRMTTIPGAIARSGTKTFAQTAKEALRTVLRPTSDFLNRPVRQSVARSGGALGKALDTKSRIQKTLRGTSTGIGLIGGLGPGVTAAVSKPDMMEGQAQAQYGASTWEYDVRSVVQQTDDDAWVEAEQQRLLASQRSNVTHGAGDSTYQTYSAVDHSFLSGLGVGGASPGVRGGV